MRAEIYTKSDCVFCVSAKQLLKNRNVEYSENIVSTTVNESGLLPTQRYVTKEDLFERVPGAKTLPQIWLDGNYIGGYTELSAFFKQN